MGVGYTLERVAYRPLRRAPRLAPLITAIGLSIILRGLIKLVWGKNRMALPPLTPDEPVLIFGAGAVAGVIAGIDIEAHFSLLAAFLALALTLAPWAAAAALRVSLD